ncbi:CSD-like protein [Mya arenaria]|uniref:CSD-like protein n=1 Tax=Mya arenaria TaxID=6604 RepID=A0ABY7DVF9_MYAAR|nr:CSD-like protein [Mya arenaria]
MFYKVINKASFARKRSAVYDANPILRYVDENVFGKDLVIETPFGSRNVVYCDYTASGRCLQFIEDYIQTKVMPTYANTHSTTGHNARQTGKFREEARNIIKKCVNANNDDVAIFTGSGATAGMHKIAWTLRINTPRVAAETAVFIGPYEHHSNILLWREYGTKVVRIRHEPDHGQIDLIQLQEELQFWKDKRRVLLVCMSAASNVTGIITDVDAVARIAHQNGALAIFDYAAGGPYLKIDMNPSKTEYKDAVILSPHKFVTRDLHSYVGNIEEREEGGTPAIIDRAFTAWESNPSIYVMGSHTADRVCIFSFLTISQETGRLVHHNFISTLLSDVFGIQARGGCACAGPYAEDLMGISEPMAKKYLWFLSEKPQRKDPNKHVQDPLEIMKPGFTRVNLSYFLDNETADFIIEAVNMVTKHGWKLLPEYSFDPFTGSWKHKSFSNTMESQLESLSSFDPTGNKTSEQTGKPTDYQLPNLRSRFVSNRYDSDDEEDDNIRYDPHTQTDKHTKHRSRRTHKDVDISPALSSRSVPEKRITNPHDTHRVFFIV